MISSPFSLSSRSILDKDDIKTLFTIDTIKHYGRDVKDYYIYAYRFFTVTGLRRGELCGLRNEDITEDTLTIRRSINTNNEETTGKNDNVRRTFMLTPTMKKILNDQREFLKTCGIISPWVFPDMDGERSDPNRLYDKWRTYREQHNISTSIHELRHTFISICKADLPLELMKQMVGHSSSMDTYGIYGHAVEGDQKRTAAIVEDVFGRVINQ